VELFGLRSNSVTVTWRRVLGREDAKESFQIVPFVVMGTVDNVNLFVGFIGRECILRCRVSW